MKYKHNLFFDTNAWPHNEAQVSCTFEADTTGKATKLLGFYAIESTQPLDVQDLKDLYEFVGNDHQQWKSA